MAKTTMLEHVSKSFIFYSFSGLFHCHAALIGIHADLNYDPCGS